MKSTHGGFILGMTGLLPHVLKMVGGGGGLKRKKRKRTHRVKQWGGLISPPFHNYNPLIVF